MIMRRFDVNLHHYTSAVVMLRCFSFVDMEGKAYRGMSPGGRNLSHVELDIPELPVLLTPVRPPSELKFTHMTGSVHFQSEGSFGRMVDSMAWQMFSHFEGTDGIQGTSIDRDGIVRVGWRYEGEALDWDIVSPEVAILRVRERIPQAEVDYGAG